MQVKSTKNRDRGARSIFRALPDAWALRAWTGARGVAAPSPHCHSLLVQRFVRIASYSPPAR